MKDGNPLAFLPTPVRLHRLQSHSEHGSFIHSLPVCWQASGTFSLSGMHCGCTVVCLALGLFLATKLCNHVSLKSGCLAPFFLESGFR